MNETKKRREWIKNAAIIFLSVLLVLTFFSGTIQNHSLPEVAVQNTTSDTVSSGIRVSGTVSASRSYNVVLDQTRTVSTVNVRNGDEVEAGAVLFELESEESEELKAARKELDALQLAYDKALLNVKGTDSSAEAQAVTNAETAYNRACQERDAYKAEQASTAEQKAYDNAVRVRDSLRKWRNGEALSSIDRDVAIDYFAGYMGVERNEMFQSQDAPLDRTFANLKPEYAGRYEFYYGSLAPKTAADSQSESTQADTQQENLTDPQENDPASSGGSSSGTLPEQKPTDAQRAIAKWKDGDYNSWDEVKDAVAGFAAYVGLADQVDSLFNVQQSFDTSYPFSAMKGDYAAYYDKVLTTANADISSASNDINAKLTSLEDAITNARQAWDNAKKALAEKQKNDANLDKQTKLDLQQQLDDIAEKQRDIEKLQEKFTDSVITAKQSGIVSDLHVTAGEKINAGDTACTIQLTGAGYTVDVSITSAQAQRVKVGSEATVSGGYYWGEKPRASVTSMRSDPNTRGNRLVTLTLTGSVEVGSSYNFVLGETSASYDVVVPKSAVREDNTGTFVLVVTNKSTPLGTRYYVTRTDVQVLASDDTRCAVSGEFEDWAYVVTSSSAPIKAGDQVRLANS